MPLATRLGERPSRMVAGGRLDAEFERNVVEILDEAAGLMAAGGTSAAAAVAVDYAAPGGFARTGALRAAQDVHPAESLMAAEVLFDVALPVLAADRGLVPGTPEGALAVARALHHAIWRRFPPGAIAYADALRQRLSSAHMDSRSRLSRDLHDRIAHGIAAAAQRVELARGADGLPAEAAAPLGQAAAVLGSVLADVRDLAVELRSRVAGRSLAEAVGEYIENSGAPASLTVAGRPGALKEWVAEELLAIVVEAIRNARQHSSAPVDVAIEWAPGRLEVSVADAGPGFDPAAVRAGAIGLADMAERAAAIGAGFHVDSSPGRPTVVTVALDTRDIREADA